MKFESMDNYPGDEDFAEHEWTFAFFLRVAAMAVLLVAACILAVAIGGLAGHWYLALVIFLLATAAARIGVASEQLSWRSSAAVLAMGVLSIAGTA